MVGELGGVGLGGPNDHVAADDTAGGGHAAWIDALDGGALEEPDATPSRGGGDAVRQARRMDDRAMGCEQRSSDVGGGAVPARLVGVEPPVVIGAEPDARRTRRARRGCGRPAATIGRDRSSRPSRSGSRSTRRRRRDRPRRRSRASPVAERSRRVASVAATNGRQAHREQRRAPSTVAAARAEPHRRPLEHRDPQRRIGRREVVAGPRAGEAGTDDHHVELGIAGQRLEAASLRVGQRVVPQRAGCAVASTVARCTPIRYASPADARP